MLVGICLHTESHETSALQYKQFNCKNKVLTGCWLLRILPLDIAHENGPTGFQRSFVSGQELPGLNPDFFVTRY